MTPFHLVYGGEAVVLIKIGMESIRISIYDKANAEKCLLELDLVKEAQSRATARLRANKQWMC